MKDRQRKGRGIEISFPLEAPVLLFICLFCRTVANVLSRSLPSRVLLNETRNKKRVMPFMLLSFRETALLLGLLLLVAPLLSEAQMPPRNVVVMGRTAEERQNVCDMFLSQPLTFTCIDGGVDPDSFTTYPLSPLVIVLLSVSGNAVIQNLVTEERAILILEGKFSSVWFFESLSSPLPAFFTGNSNFPNPSTIRFVRPAAPPSTSDFDAGSISPFYSLPSASSFYIFDLDPNACTTSALNEANEPAVVTTFVFPPFHNSLFPL